METYPDIFVMFCYINMKPWFCSPFLTTAAYNNPELYGSLLNFNKIHKIKTIQTV